MKGKKGIELSLNFLVVLILSIVVLVGGITLTRSFLSTVEDQEEMVDAQTKRQIESLLGPLQHRGGHVCGERLAQHALGHALVQTQTHNQGI